MKAIAAIIFVLILSSCSLPNTDSPQPVTSLGDRTERVIFAYVVPIREVPFGDKTGWAVARGRAIEAFAEIGLNGKPLVDSFSTFASDDLLYRANLLALADLESAGSADYIEAVNLVMDLADQRDSSFSAFMKTADDLFKYIDAVEAQSATQAQSAPVTSSLPVIRSAPVTPSATSHSATNSTGAFLGALLGGFLGAVAGEAPYWQAERGGSLNQQMYQEQFLNEQRRQTEVLRQQQPPYRPSACQFGAPGWSCR